MENPEFKVGDMVKMKSTNSDRPVMTINKIDGEKGNYLCLWWSGGRSGRYCKKKFSKGALEIFTPPPQ